MITINNLTKKILGEPLFKGVSFILNKGDKVGLVGPNGSGKSTLMKIILGLVEADEGGIQTNHERIGYLSQELEIEDGNTIENFLSTNPIKMKDILKQVGLNKIQTNFVINNLSGGQKARLSMAKILLQNPTVLLLDEPTNHLDTEGLEWLEQLIREFQGIVFIISHDRKLLDNSIQKILEIDPMNHKFNVYFGGYTKYINEKQERIEILEDRYFRQQREKRRLEEWLVLKRQDAHVRPDPAKGKQIRAMEKRLEREIYNKEISRPRDYWKIKGMNLKGETPPAKLIARCKDITKILGEKSIIKNADFEIRGEERVLLSGENGSGKTTLLKIIFGELKQDSGVVKIGDNINIGYFAQEHEMLDMNKTVFEEFNSTERLIDISKDPRAILGSFLFKNQDVFKRVSSLSQGERVRLIFAKLTNQINEFLILDEPTNHLDIESREIIENALIEYGGAIIAVSHDRYFIEKIGFNKILKISNGIIK